MQQLTLVAAFTLTLAFGGGVAFAQAGGSSTGAGTAHYDDQANSTQVDVRFGPCNRYSGARTVSLQVGGSITNEQIVRVVSPAVKTISCQKGPKALGWRVIIRTTTTTTDPVTGNSITTSTHYAANVVLVYKEDSTGTPVLLSGPGNPAPRPRLRVSNITRVTPVTVSTPVVVNTPSGPILVTETSTEYVDNPNGGKPDVEILDDSTSDEVTWTPERLPNSEPRRPK